jgi:hypothetical protein
MATPEHYRSEAARCRELAAKSADASATRRWLELALDYEQLAKSLGPAPDNASSTPAGRDEDPSSPSRPASE